MREAIGADFGLRDPAVEAARRQALEYLRLEAWGQPLPRIAPEVAVQVQQLRREALELQAARRAAGAAAVERQNQRDRAAQAERERRMRMEEARQGF